MAQEAAWTDTFSRKSDEWEWFRLPMRGVALIPSTVTKTLVCVDEFHGGDMSGTCYNPYMEEPRGFGSIFSLLLIMDEFFNAISFPHSYCGDRAFILKTKQPLIQKKKEVVQYMSEDIFESEQGKKATFVIQVQFRQNATWQGTITWTDEKRTQRFRSALEMVKLMDNALGESTDERSSSSASWE